jgi:signal transduction histidine kinase
MPDPDNGDMGTGVASPRVAGSMPWIRHGLAAAFDRLRSRRTRLELGYVLVGLPLAVVGFVFVVVSVVLGAALSVTFVGLPLLALGGVAARRLAAIQRALAYRLLGERVVPPPPREPGPGFLGWLQAALRDPASWRARAYLLVKLPLVLVTFYLTALVWLQGLFWLTYPITWQVTGPGRAVPNPFLDVGALIFRGSSDPRPHVAHRMTLFVGDTAIDMWPGVLAVAMTGALALLAAPSVTHGLLAIDRRLAQGLLGRPAGADRVRQLERARDQVVDESATTLRRIERDLHDGTQAQLATLAMTLGQAKEKLENRSDVPFDPAGALGLVDTAHRHAKEALVELRDIARGIHPPALDLGLDAALTTLVARSAVPAVLNSAISTRPGRATETIAYFSVAELLANAARHSRARHVVVEVATRAETLRLQVSDDGQGGARPGGGSGLTGLTERVRAVDGRLHIHSPAGGPTVITVELPLTA